MNVICTITQKIYTAYAKAEFVYKSDVDEAPEVSYLIKPPHGLGGAANFNYLKTIYDIKVLYVSPDINLDIGLLNDYEWADEPEYSESALLTNDSATVFLNKNKHYA